MYVHVYVPESGHVSIRLAESARVKVVDGVINDPHDGNVCAPIMGGTVQHADPADTLQWQPYGVCLKARGVNPPQWLHRLGDVCVAALECVMSASGDVETVSRAVDMWNSTADLTDILRGLLDAVLDGHDVEPDCADLYIRALHVLRRDGAMAMEGTAPTPAGGAASAAAPAAAGAAAFTTDTPTAEALAEPSKLPWRYE